MTDSINILYDRIKITEELAHKSDRNMAGLIENQRMYSDIIKDLANQLRETNNELRKLRDELQDHKLIAATERAEKKGEKKFLKKLTENKDIINLILLIIIAISTGNEVWLKHIGVLK